LVFLNPFIEVRGDTLFLYNQVIFEGTTGSGVFGDIAIDDLAIIYGSCSKIDYYGKV